MYNDQRLLLSKVFSSAQIGPIQYGSVDGGLIGLPDVLPGGVDQDPTSYTVNTSSTIMELITDTAKLITEDGVKGNVVITNLTRRLMLLFVIQWATQLNGLITALVSFAYVEEALWE